MLFRKSFSCLFVLLGIICVVCSVFNNWYGVFGLIVVVSTIFVSVLFLLNNKRRWDNG
jgi:membrane-bound ClpP family serine protease